MGHIASKRKEARSGNPEKLRVTLRSAIANGAG